ncbi:MAG TPA: MFS transporter [Solirubrobacteraceae bacterium]|nr:MFS transporter [Solirubrobacteraceae bacterium]
MGWSLTGGATARLKQATLLACIIASGIGVLDSTIVNIALPTIQRSLGGGLAGQQWIVNAYLLTLGSLILIGGSLEDIFGARRVFPLGVFGFGVASILCGLSPSIGVLVACRALQGVAGALLVPSSLAVIVATFPEEERGRAVGTWTAFTTIATVVGPLAGGALLAVASWRWLFFINVPFVAICLGLILRVIPLAIPTKTRRSVDLRGGLLCVLGLGGAVFALIEETRLGWGSPAVLIPLCGGGLALCSFVIAERRAGDPMLPLGLFSRRNFAVANAETLLVYAGLAVLILFLVLFLQQVAGYSPLNSGLALFPTTVVMFACSRAFGALAGRLGPRGFMGAGPLIGACGLLLLLRVGARPSYLADLLPAIIVFGLGLSMTVAPLTATVLSDIDTHQAGIASAVNNAIARVAALVGTAAVGSVLAGTFAASLDSRLAGVKLGAPARAAELAAKHIVLGRPSVAHLPPAQAHALLEAARAASVGSFHVAVVIAAALLALGGLAGVAGIENRPPRSKGPSAPKQPRSAKTPRRASDQRGGLAAG